MNAILRVQVGGQGGPKGEEYPRGLLPEMHRKGWGPLMGKVLAAVVKHRPLGVIFANPWGENKGDMRLDARDALAREIPGSAMLELAPWAEGLEDIWNELDAHTTGRPVVGVYLGGSIGAGKTLLDYASAYDRALRNVIPPQCTPIIDFLGSTHAFGQTAVATMRKLGFAHVGYECPPHKGYPLNADLCYITGEWWSRHLGLADRIPSDQLGHEVVVQCEPPFDTPAKVAEIQRNGFIPAVEWFRAAEYAPAADPATLGRS
jgi:hypothetical protein